MLFTEIGRLDLQLEESFGGKRKEEGRVGGTERKLAKIGLNSSSRGDMSLNPFSPFVAKTGHFGPISRVCH